MSRDILQLPAPPADAREAYGPDPVQVGDLRLPSGAGPHPVVVVIHGGFWRAARGLDYFGHACADLTARGWATWNIEYRRVGDLGGGWPGTFEDVVLAVDHPRKLAPDYGLDLGRMVALGHSAGGQLALWLAAGRRMPLANSRVGETPLPLRGVVSLAGVLDLRRAWELGLGEDIVETFLGGPPDRVPERYASASPIELLPIGVPQVLVHGTADDRMPIEIAERYHAAAQARGDSVELVSLPGAGHFEVVDPRSHEWATVVAAVERLLTPGG